MKTFKITYNLGIPPYYGEMTGIFAEDLIYADTEEDARNQFYDTHGDYYITKVEEAKDDSSL